MRAAGAFCRGHRVCALQTSQECGERYRCSQPATVGSLRIGPVLMASLSMNALSFQSITLSLICTSDQRSELMASLLPALRHAAPRLTRRLFQCPHRRLHSTGTFQCQRRGGISSQNFSKTKIRGQTPSRLISGFTQDAGTFSERSSPLGSLGKSFESQNDRKRYFPEKSSKSVAYWLLGSAASVFGIVVFGGLTRLTESGYDELQIRKVIC